MKNNQLHSFLAACLFVTSATAQPTPAQALPTPPSATDQHARAQSLSTKSAQLKTAETDYETAKLALIQGELLQFGIPKLNNAAQDAALQKRAYPGYLVGFSAEHGEPQWSYHAIERDIFDVCLAREDNFFEDLSLAGAPRLSQYRSSGFQRGHMAPAADFRWSPKASVASNTLTNIAPQAADLNEGLWADLEISARHYLQVRDSLSELLVVTGPLLQSGLRKLKDTSRVSIPLKFFKVVVNLQDQQGFAFLMESSVHKVAFNQVEPELRKRAMTIDSLENIAGIDFFPNFSATQNQNIEGRLDLEAWFSASGASGVRNAAPITDPALLTDAFNTVMITGQNRKDRKAVVGTVVKVAVGPGGGFGLFLDQPSPNHRFQILIQARDAAKFVNPSLPDLLGQVVRAEGTIAADGQRFKMSIRDPKKLKVLRL